MLGILDSVMPHVRRFGFSGVFALGVVVMVFGINPITVLTGQAADHPPYTPLTALEAIESGDVAPADMAEAVARETDGFWARGFRNDATYYPPATLKMVQSRGALGCGLA
ncbi:MAG: neutral zinc metallopeptidase, partial [Candidatus Devosia euplotis]|nr:neutral zinc metallopeptidase [Candidatus Devosia euplotis]